MTLPEPLPEPVESTANVSDFYTTKRFREIFDHEDNADVSRMFVVGLATADPPRVDPAKAPADLSAQIEKARQHASMSYTDKDGDTVRFFYVEGECPEHGTERVVALAINGEGAVAIPVENLGPIVAYLGARLAGIEPTES